MQILLIIVIALHALPGVFWAGTTFALARTGGIGMESLIRPQLGAAAVTVLMGLVLWGLNHRYGFGRGELVLAIGAISAIAAAGLQSRALSAVRRLQAAGGEAEAAAHSAAGRSPSRGRRPGCWPSPSSAWWCGAISEEACHAPA